MKTRAIKGVLSALALAASLSAQAQVKIGVIASATGPTAFVGIPQKNTVPLLPTRIGDVGVEYIYYDDASDATQTVYRVRNVLDRDDIPRSAPLH